MRKAFFHQQSWEEMQATHGTTMSQDWQQETLPSNPMVMPITQLPSWSSDLEKKVKSPRGTLDSLNGFNIFEHIQKKR